MTKGQNENSYPTLLSHLLFFPFNPFNTKLLLIFKAFTGNSDLCGMKMKKKPCLTHYQNSLREYYFRRYFYFSNQTHTMTTHFRDHVYFAESHILNTGLSRREAAYSPTLFMLQIGLTEKPHQFVLK